MMEPLLFKDLSIFLLIGQIYRQFTFQMITMARIEPI